MIKRFWFIFSVVFGITIITTNSSCNSEHTGNATISNIIKTDSTRIDTTLFGTIDVSLDKNTSLTIIDKNIDSLTLLLDGHALFSVSKDVRNPIAINTSTETTFVQKGTCDIKNRKNNFNLFVTENAVSVLTSKRRIDVPANKQLFSKNGDYILIYNADPNRTAWQSRSLVFNQTNLPKVLDAIQDVYDIEINYNGVLSDIAQCYVTAELNKKSFKEVAAFLSKKYGIKVSQTGKNQLSITEVDCD